MVTMNTDSTDSLETALATGRMQDLEQDIVARWGHMRLVRKWRKPILLPNKLDGGFYVADPNGPKWITLQCDCGYTVDIPEHQFPGRRQLRWCQRPECRYKPGYHPRVARERGASYSVYLSRDTGSWAVAYGKEHGQTLSAVMQDALHAYRIQKLLDD